MSDNFGSKFAAVILAVLTIALAASSHHAASVNYSPDNAYNNNPAAELRYDVRSYQDTANYHVDYAGRNDYSYENYDNAKRTDYNAYGYHHNEKYSAQKHLYAAYHYVYAHKRNRAYYELNYAATRYLYNSPTDAPIYANARHEHKVYEQSYI